MAPKVVKNPIATLLSLLPHQIADQKRKAIESDLHEIGKYQHFRQSVKRENWNMGDTHVSCASILMKHLGLSIEFFSSSEKEQDEEVARLVKQHYDEVLA